MSWRLAHNLQVRKNEVHAVYPGLTIYSIGDQEHQATRSDHNPDSTGVVHAIDIMCAAGSAEAKRILPWLLGWHKDLQYVIHNRHIWGVNSGGWSKGEAYDGGDPHTSHIHVSGKHGSAHQNSATGTGYDLAAEAMTPPPLEEDDMQLSDKLPLMQRPDVPYTDSHGNRISSTTVGGILASTNYYVLSIGKQVNAKLAQIIDLLSDSTAVTAAIRSASADLPVGIVVDETTMKNALVAALKEIIAEDSTGDADAGLTVDG